ncbi:type I restriction-modification system subunit M [Empedobacter tilapiae]
MTQNKVDVKFIFEITDKVLWNTFKKNEVGDVILPFVVLRRLDCILKDKNQAVLEVFNKFRDKLNEDKLDPILKKAAGGLQFYNTSKHTLESLRESTKTIDIDFFNYINAFNEVVQDIFENFQFDKIVSRLIKNKLLYEMVDAICNVDLSLEAYDNHKMGLVFEELIRISNEQSNQTAGEHFTPRDVIRLMNTIIFSTEKETLEKSGIIRTIYDPTMGTGGMTNLAKNYILDELVPNAKPIIKTYGQEINEQSYAIARSEALITGGDVDNYRHGNTLTEDKFPNERFHYQLANPPYGVTWAKDADYVVNESTNPAGRFFAGLPAKSDGQLLFIQHMISKMEENEGKVAVVTNGSPLFSAGAGSGESNIRRWIIEEDLLDCIVGLPKDMFYNTGIPTYIWFLNKNKQPHRKAKVQLINASIVADKQNNIEGFAVPMKKSLGNKRNEIKQKHINKILDLYQSFEDNKSSKIFDNNYFGYYQITVTHKQEDENGKLKKVSDKENIPLTDDIQTYFDNEVLPHIPEAKIEYDKTRIGYEINFSKYFYEFKELRSAKEIEEEIKALEYGTDNEKGIAQLLNDLFA